MLRKAMLKDSLVNIVDSERWLYCAKRDKTRWLYCVELNTIQYSPRSGQLSVHKLFTSCIQRCLVSRACDRLMSCSVICHVTYFQT